MDISRELFDRQRRPRFGTANPERMRVEFWEWMARTGTGPWKVRSRLGVSDDRGDGPVWTFDRMGATSTDLGDGRVVWVGGEHEDYYDPDFHIYNDVVVVGPSGRVEIYGYPADVFPPTDFHTATRVGGEVVIVGRLGRPEDRVGGLTPVYRLSLADYSIRRAETTGRMPGWVFRHEAELAPGESALVVRGGEVVDDPGGGRPTRKNHEDYELDLRAWVWTRRTSRGWSQFAVCQEGHGLFVLEANPDFESFRPTGVANEVLPGDGLRTHRIRVGGVDVTFTVEVSAVYVVVEGDLPPGVARGLVEEVRRNIESAIRKPCVLVPLTE